MDSGVGEDEMDKRMIFAPARIRTPIVPPLASHVTELSHFSVCIADNYSLVKIYLHHTIPNCAIVRYFKIIALDYLGSLFRIMPKLLPQQTLTNICSRDFVPKVSSVETFH
jgi:hypothetical protein